MLIQYTLIVTATFPPPGGRSGVGCFRQQEEKSGCWESVCPVLTNPPQFQRWGWKTKIQSLACAIAVLHCSSGQQQPWARNSFPHSGLLSTWALGQFCAFEPLCPASDRLRSQSSPFPQHQVVLNVVLHQPGRETLLFQQNWHQSTSMAVLNRRVQKSPPCY